LHAIPSASPVHVERGLGFVLKDDMAQLVTKGTHLASDGMGRIGNDHASRWPDMNRYGRKRASPTPDQVPYLFARYVREVVQRSDRNG